MQREVGREELGGGGSKWAGVGVEDISDMLVSEEVPGQMLGGGGGGGGEGRERGGGGGGGGGEDRWR